jgi:hypothetical protein
MAVSILEQDDVLIAGIQSDLSDRDLLQLRDDDVAEKVGRCKSLGVMIDISVLDVMESFATRTLRTIVDTTGCVVASLDIGFRCCARLSTLSGTETCWFLRPAFAHSLAQKS